MALPYVRPTDQSEPVVEALPPPSPNPVLVVLLVVTGGCWRLLVQVSGYLFLHEPQLITQVCVDFHQLLDLGLGDRQRVLHFLELLHGDWSVGEVRVQALLHRGNLFKKVTFLI